MREPRPLPCWRTEQNLNQSPSPFKGSISTSVQRKPGDGARKMSLWRNLRSLETRNLDVALSQRENILVAGHLPSAIFRERLSAAQNLYQRNLTGHYGCVNALEFSSGGQFLASGKWRYLLISFRPPS